PVREQLLRLNGFEVARSLENLVPCLEIGQKLRGQFRWGRGEAEFRNRRVCQGGTLQSCVRTKNRFRLVGICAYPCRGFTHSSHEESYEIPVVVCPGSLSQPKTDIRSIADGAERIAESDAASSDGAARKGLDFFDRIHSTCPEQIRQLRNCTDDPPDAVGINSFFVKNVQQREVDISSEGQRSDCLALEPLEIGDATYCAGDDICRRPFRGIERSTRNCNNRYSLPRRGDQRRLSSHRDVELSAKRAD